MTKPNKARSAANLKPCLLTSRPARLGWLPVLALFLLAGGCARQPWGNMVDEHRHTMLSAQYENFQRQTQRCSDGYDGNLALTWRTRLEQVSLAGYYRIMDPSFLRLTVANPLGQPLLVLAAGTGQYQVLHVPRRTFYAGSMRSYGLRNGIPLPFLSGTWFSWVTGRPPSVAQIAAIRDDDGARGIWFALVTADDRRQPLEHLLFDPAEQQIRERLIVDARDELLARVTYQDWQPIDGCALPHDIAITGLSFGTTAHLRFSDVAATTLTGADFRLRPPPNYLRELMP